MQIDPFFIVGAQRSGTTYLCHILDQHPEIAMAKPFKPEPKYFLNPSEALINSDHYLNKYFVGEQKPFKGEKSTSYLENPEVPNRINKMFPKSRIIISLRDPALRAVSNYYFTRSNGIESRPIREAIFSNAEQIQFSSSVSPFTYLERGKYAGQIKNYFDVFGHERVHVVIFSRLVGNVSAISKMYQFIGASPSFLPDGLDDKINAGHDHEADLEILAELRAYYQPYNAELESLLGIKIAEWNG